MFSVLTISLCLYKNKAAIDNINGMDMAIFQEIEKLVVV